MKFQEVLKYCILVAIMFGLAGSVQAQSMAVTLSQMESLNASDPYCNAYPAAITTATRDAVGEDGVDPGCVSTTLLEAPNFAVQDGDGNNVGVVDWVLVEVRAAEADAPAAEFTTFTVQIPALLLSNGLVVDAAKFAELDEAAKTVCATVGSSCDDADVEVPAAAFPDEQDIRLVLRHRNHLDIMSAEAVEEEGGVRSVDFSSVTSSYSPSAAVPVVWSYNDTQVGDLARILQPYPGVAFMVPGDTDGNGVVEPTDVTGVTGYTGAFINGNTSGYQRADTSMNNVVEPNDVTERGYTTAFISGVAESRVPK